MNQTAAMRGLIGLCVGLGWIGGLFIAVPLVGGFGLVPITEWLIRQSPGWISILAIDQLGFYAKPAVVLGVIVCFVTATILAALLWPRESRFWQIIAILVGVLTTSVLFFGVGASISIGFLAGLIVAIAPPYFVARTLTTPSVLADRRRFLTRLGGTVVGGVVVLGGVRIIFDTLSDPQRTPRADDSLEPYASPPRGDPAFDFAGMPSAVTPPREHYVIDINIANPRIDLNTWTLVIEGAVNRPYSLTYDELLAHESRVEQTTTMLCISNPIGGELIGTGHWTGVQLSDLIREAEPTDEAVDVVTHAADGYSEAIPISQVEREDILLAYGMGERTLPIEHGFPVRLIIPGRYGMKMTKWITRIDIVGEEHEAYWESRSWDAEAIVQTMSYVRGAERDGDRVMIGGVAFAGLETGVKEIATVEVSTDGGTTWHEAEVEDQLDIHAWRRWRYLFDAPIRSEYDVVCRAIKRDGTVQTSEVTDPRPSGATGWHRKTVRI